MSWTTRDEVMWRHILEWENKYLADDKNDISQTVEAWLAQQFKRFNPSLQNKVHKAVDQLLFYLHSIIQHANVQEEARERILNEARLFDENIQKIFDLKGLKIDQLRYMTDQQIARQRLYAASQGGVTGMGGLFLMGIDFPTLIAMNLRSVQLIAVNYGYEVGVPGEMMTSLKVFHTSCLPKGFRYQSWKALEEEIHSDEFDPFFYEGEERLNHSHWFEQAFKQVAKLVAVQMLRKKMLQGIPVLGIAFGAGMNYQFSKQVTECAHYFYQKRYLRDKQ